jgi:ribonuclease HI
MEISAVIAGLNYLPSGMVIWLSTDSQYVQKGVTEWMPKWKKNGWRNSKKSWIANKSLWLELEAAIARHRRIEFTWVKAHSGILHNEIVDTLATRGVKGNTYCPINWFDQLPEDTETEDDPNIPPTEVITQTEEFGADEEHLPSFGTPAVVYGFNDEEAAERAEERDRSIRHFLYEQCGNSSTPVSEVKSFMRRTRQYLYRTAGQHLETEDQNHKIKTRNLMPAHRGGIPDGPWWRRNRIRTKNQISAYG